MDITFYKDAQKTQIYKSTQIHIHKVLGKGSYGVVYEVTLGKGKKIYALKHVHKRKFSINELKLGLCTYSMPELKNITAGIVAWADTEDGVFYLMKHVDDLRPSGYSKSLLDDYLKLYELKFNDIVRLVYATRLFTLCTGYVHGDLHGDNVVVVHNKGKIHTFILIDLGLSQPLLNVYLHSNIRKPVHVLKSPTKKQKLTERAALSHYKFMDETLNKLPFPSVNGPRDEYVTMNFKNGYLKPFAPNGRMLQKIIHPSILKDAFDKAEIMIINKMFSKTYANLNDGYKYNKSKKKWIK